MGILSIFKRSAFNQPTFSDTNLLDGIYMLSNYGAFGESDSGVVVTPETAMQAAAVYSCVSRITRDLSTLPIHVIDRQDNAKVPSHPVARLLRSPNEFQTPATFWTSYLMNALLYGNGYAAIEYAGNGITPVGLVPMMAASTIPRRENGELIYITRPTGHQYSLRPDQVVHTPYMSLNGITGQSPIAAAKRTISVSIALDKFFSTYFANGANVGSVLELPPMSKEAQEATYKAIKDQYSGVANSNKLLAIPGVKVHKLGNTLKDSQSVEAQDFQLRQIARIWNVPVGIIDPEKSKYAGLEAQYRDYAQATLRPWAVMVEQEFGRKLFTPAEQDRYKIEFNLDAIVRASLAERTTADTSLVQAGIMTVNEARAHHNLPPLDGGDSLMSPLNMTPAAERSGEPSPETRSKGNDMTRDLLTSIVSNVVTKEVNAIRRGLKQNPTVDEFRVWATGFFNDHVEHVRNVIASPVKAPADYAQRYCSETCSQVCQARDDEQLEALLDSWANDRPAAIVDELMNDKAVAE